MISASIISCAAFGFGVGAFLGLVFMAGYAVGTLSERKKNTNDFGEPFFNMYFQDWLAIRDDYYDAMRKVGSFEVEFTSLKQLATSIGTHISASENFIEDNVKSDLAKAYIRAFAVSDLVDLAANTNNPYLQRLVNTYGHIAHLMMLGEEELDSEDQVSDEEEGSGEEATTAGQDITDLL